MDKEQEFWKYWKRRWPNATTDEKKLSPSANYQETRAAFLAGFYAGQVTPMGVKEEGRCEVCGEEASVQITKRHLGIDKVAHEFCNDCADNNAYIMTKW